MIYPHGETVTILHPGVPTVDPDYGTEIPGTPIEEDVPLAAVAPGDTRENVDQQQTSEVAFTVYLPAGPDVEATAQMVVRGDTYEVEGAPQEWRNPFTGWEPGTVVALRRAQ